MGLAAKPALNHFTDKQTVLLCSLGGQTLQAEAGAQHLTSESQVSGLFAHTVAAPGLPGGMQKPHKSRSSCRSVFSRRRLLTITSPFAKELYRVCSHTPFQPPRLGQSQGEEPCVFPSQFLGLTLNVDSDYITFLLSLFLCVLLDDTSLRCWEKSS